MLTIIRDVMLLWVLTFISGFLARISLPPNSTLVEALPIIGVFNIVFLIVGFFIVGYLNKQNRFKHLTSVAIILWLGSFVNVLLFQAITVESWLLSIVVIFITMLIGGGISLLVEQI